MIGCGQAACARFQVGMGFYRIACLTALLGASTACSGQSLYDLLMEAKSYDVKYLSSKSAEQAAAFKAAQTRAALRPSLDATGSVAREQDEFPVNKQANTLVGLLGGAGDDVEQQTQYNTQKQIGLQAKQAIYNRGSSLTVEQAELSVQSAQVDVQLVEQDLILRVCQAYFDLLAADEALALAQASRDAALAQAVLSKRGYELGKTTITDEREVRAKLDIANAQLLSAQNDVEVKQLSLDRLVGQHHVIPLQSTDKLKAETLDPKSGEQWLADADSALSVIKAQLTAEIAHFDVELARADGLPTLSLVGSLSKSRNSLNTYTAPSGTTSISSIGVQANIPLFHGMAIQNKVGEKLQLEEKARLDLEGARRDAQLKIDQLAHDLTSSIAQVAAQQSSVDSSKLALAATQRAYQVGIRLSVDVLNAEKQVHSTMSDLAKARHDAILNAVKLNQAIGGLDDGYIKNLTAQLVAP